MHDFESLVALVSSRQILPPQKKSGAGACTRSDAPISREAKAVPILAPYICVYNVYKLLEKKPVQINSPFGSNSPSWRGAAC